jgi:hypothetical protein
MVKPGVELDFSFVWKITAGYMKASVMEQTSDEPCPLKVFYIKGLIPLRLGQQQQQQQVTHTYRRPISPSEGFSILLQLVLLGLH